MLLNGAAWFVAADACKAIGLAAKKGSFRHHLDKLEADEITLLSDSGVKLPGKGMASAKLISEPGLYKLIQASNKPEAKRFDRWVRHDVLPAIRKDGAYVAGEVRLVSDTGQKVPTAASYGLAGSIGPDT